MAKRVLYLSHGSDVSGAEKSMLALIDGLDRDRFRPLVLVPQPGDLVDELDRRSVSHEIVPFGPASIRQPTRLLRDTASIRRFLRERRVALVHANSFHAIKQALIAARLAAVPLVGSIRDIVPFTSLTRRAIFNCDRVVCVSMATRENLLQGEGEDRRDRLRVIYNGVDVEGMRSDLSRSEARSRLGLSSGEPSLIGMIAPLVRWKGQHVLLEALAQMRERGVSARVLLAGDTKFSGAEFGDSLLELARSRGVEGQVDFVGFRHDIPDVLAALDVVVCASTEPDPFPRAVIEAMAAAVPVVASELGGIPEAIETDVSGFLVPPNDPAALASTLIRVLSEDEARFRVGVSARERIMRNFSIAHHCEAVQSLYDDLIGDS